MAGIGGRSTGNGVPLVLVVDDDALVVDFLGMALEDEGYDVVTAANGAEALAVLREHAPNIILLDLRMPVLDGWSFLREYRRLPDPHAAVIALTAGQYDPIRHPEIEADGFFVKPFSLDSLLALVALYTGHDGHAAGAHCASSTGHAGAGFFSG